MAKRLSRQEFEHLMAEAKAAYLRDMQAAGGDNAKVSLADHQYHWAEEAAKDAFNERSGFYKFFDGVPLIGKPVAILIDHVEKGIAEHGLVLGLAKGALVGGLIAVALAVASEVVPIVYDIGRSWLDIHYVAGIKAGQKQAVTDAQDARELKKLRDDEAQQERAGAEFYASLPAIVSPAVRFVGMDRFQYERTAQGDPQSRITAQSMTRYFVENRTVDDSAARLPLGTRFSPYLQRPGDPTSVVTIGEDYYSGVLVTVWGKDGDQEPGMIPKRAYLESLKARAAGTAAPAEPIGRPAPITVRPDVFPLTVSSKDGYGTIAIEVTNQYRYKIAVTQDQSTNPDPEMQHYAAALAEHRYTTQLPEGTRYTPVLDSANRLIVIMDQNGSNPGFLATVTEGADDEKHFLIPFDQFKENYQKIAGGVAALR